MGARDARSPGKHEPDHRPFSCGRGASAASSGTRRSGSPVFRHAPAEVCCSSARRFHPAQTWTPHTRRREKPPGYPSGQSRAGAGFPERSDDPFDEEPGGERSADDQCAAQGCWDLSQCAIRPRRSRVIRRSLSTIRTQGRSMLAAMTAVFEGSPFWEPGT